jgi:CheY-like chemotaxis protein
MTKNKRILIVEDDPDWQEEIAELLSGFELIAASSVGEACQRINEGCQENCTIDLGGLDKS